MDSAPQLSFHQGALQPAASFPITVPRCGAHFTPVPTQYPQRNFQQVQSFAGAPATNLYSMSNGSHTLLPSSTTTSFYAPPLSTQSMAHAVQGANYQVKRYQDEVEALMMATDAIRPSENSTTDIWQGDIPVDGVFTQAVVPQSSWQSTTSLIDQKAHPYVTSTMMEEASTLPQTRSAIPTYTFASSFTSDGTNPGLGSYEFSPFGSYSDRSEMGETLSSMSPTDVQFETQVDSVRIWGNNQEEPLFHGLPFSSHDDNQSSHWTNDVFTQSNWLVHGPNAKSAEQSSTLQHVRPSLILYNQDSSSVFVSSDDIKAEHGFGSPLPSEVVSGIESRENLTSQSLPTSHPRNARDELLVQLRLRGLSYREIKFKGGYIEAESTLRGRFRTLTKEKIDRVRKPQWHPEDVRPHPFLNPKILKSPTNHPQCRLLGEAVHQFVGAAKARKAKSQEDVDRLSVQWKEVANYIANNGGSYHFGNATCKKKWMELTGVRRR
jgi:hypothetical protein